MDEALIACRFLHFAAAMLLFGTGAFQAFLAPPELSRALAHALRRIIVWTSLIIAITSVLWLTFEAGQMGEGWADAWNQDWIDQGGVKISYNGVATIAKKAQLAKTYGGVMIWAVPQDAAGDHSLLKAIDDNL